MKKKAVLLGIILISFFSCTKLLDGLLTFEVPVQQTVNLPDTLLLAAPFDITSEPMETGIQQTLERNKTRSDLVKEVQVSELKITITHPSGDHFDFLKDIYVEIIADGLNNVLLAQKESVPDGLTELNLDIVSSADLKEYILKDHIRYRVYGSTDHIVYGAKTFNTDMRFKVNANPLR